MTESLVGVPMLRSANLGAVTATGVGTASKTVGGEGTRVRQQRQIRGLRSIAMASLGVALVASVAASVATLRGKKARSGAVAVLAERAKGECAKSAECNAGDGAADPRVCRAGKCVALRTSVCEVLAEPGDANDDRTIWIGAMFPRTGAEGDSFGRADINAVELARRDFLETTRGIPGHGADDAPRPLGVIACDDTKDEKGSARHLASDVGVPAVIGFRTSQESIELSRDVFVPQGLFVASVDHSAQVTQVPQPRDGPRLVWRTVPSSTLSTIPAARLVSDLLEPRLRKAGIVTAASPMRVAFLRQNNQYGLATAEVMGKNLSFNGRPAHANGESFVQLVYEQAKASAPRPDFAVIVSQLLALAPHAILYAGEDELVSTVFAPVERDWPAKAPRPYWVSVSPLVGDSFFAFLGTNVERRRRFFGITTPETSPANAQLAMHYSSELGDKVTVNDTPASAYDAAYLLAYAAVVAGDAPLTGRILAGSLPRLSPPGEPIEVGPTHIFEAIQTLARGGNIDLVGAETTLDFDLATGEPTVEMVVQCAGVDARGAVSAAIESGVVFDPATGKLRGELACP